MKTIKYHDGSQAFIYEAGDRVILKDYPDDWIAKSGDHATVYRPQGFSHPLIDFLEVRTDAMVAGKWGIITVPPWQLVPETAKPYGVLHVTNTDRAAFQNVESP